jgi:hypothetical protein
MLMGVSYRLVGMFSLSEDRLQEGWACAALVCVDGGAWTLAAGLLGVGRWTEMMGAAGLLAGLALFAAQLLHLYGGRRRRQFDVHIPFALTAAGFGLTAVGLGFFGLVTGRSATDSIWIAAGWLAIAGWAETPIQGFLYKIGTFLTWLHRYDPVPGCSQCLDSRTSMAVAPPSSAGLPGRAECCWEPLQP